MQRQTPPADRIDELIRRDENPDMTAEQAQRIHDAWVALLTNRNGRRIARDLLTLCHFGRSAQAGVRELTDYNTGKQAIGEYIIEQINTCYPEAYPMMLAEAREDEEHDRQSRDARAGDSDSSTAIRQSGTDE